MAVGNPVNTGALNGKLGTAAVAAKTSAQYAAELFEWLNTLGADEAAIVAALGAPPYDLQPADAQNMYNYVGYLNTLAGVYFGNATQPSVFDFDTALAEPRGISFD